MGRRLRFRGGSRHKVDSKGRVSIPASFRRVLELGDPDYGTNPGQSTSPSFVMVFGNPGYNFIECYTIEEMERIEDRIDAMPYGDARDALELIYSSNAETARVDDTGRIVIPAKLREQFSIGDEAMLVSSLNTFRIWDAATYDAEQAERSEELAKSLPRNPLALLDEVKE